MFIIVFGFFIILYLFNPPMPGLYPPNIATCPDYWKLDLSGNCLVPNESGINRGNINLNINKPGYNTTNKSIDFKIPYWVNPCDKKKWANMYGIEWEGISNYNGC
jgi:hypothetical protein